MTRTMIDATHVGLPLALPVIKALPPGNIVALYDTGSPDISATPADLAQIPFNIQVAFIDQGFTDSPNPAATVRDCENGAWSLSRAVVLTGWLAARPTLYLGYPDTVIKAYNAGWRGDVWLAMSSARPPIAPPIVPSGINVVAIQWYYVNPNYDKSVVFDSRWPLKEDPIPPPIRSKTMLLIHITGYAAVYLWNGTFMSYVTSVPDEDQFKAAGVPSVAITPAQFMQLTGAPKSIPGVILTLLA